MTAASHDEHGDGEPDHPAVTVAFVLDRYLVFDHLAGVTPAAGVLRTIVSGSGLLHDDFLLGRGLPAQPRYSWVRNIRANGAG